MTSLPEGAAAAGALEGGCLCGAVRYRVTAAPFDETLCHCADCRRAAGAPAVAWFSVGREALRFTASAPASYRSSPKVVRRFCGRCGTQLTFEPDGEDALDVTTASLDEAAAVPPRDHSWVASRIAWDAIGDTLPQFRTTRTAG